MIARSRIASLLVKEGPPKLGISARTVADVHSKRHGGSSGNLVSKLTHVTRSSRDFERGYALRKVDKLNGEVRSRR